MSILEFPQIDKQISSFSQYSVSPKNVTLTKIIKSLLRDTWLLKSKGNISVLRY
jgi:hypothetical protein